jgi:hypothetical protein
MEFEGEQRRIADMGNANLPAEIWNSGAPLHVIFVRIGISYAHRRRILSIEMKWLRRAGATGLHCSQEGRIDRNFGRI